RPPLFVDLVRSRRRAALSPSGTAHHGASPSPSIRRRTGMKTLLLLTSLLITAATGLAAQGTGIVVNGRPLTGEMIRSLEAFYRVRMAPGTYWYDPYSGAWGLEGGPVAGLILPGLELGGSLREDASA